MDPAVPSVGAPDPAVSCSGNACRFGLEKSGRYLLPLLFMITRSAASMMQLNLCKRLYSMNIKAEQRRKDMDYCCWKT
uniref:Uncharacterized protein n=1 Tax=Oryza barthii TaxID=65489 RepID=A0A0D3H5K5_9ORYZ